MLTIGSIRAMQSVLQRRVWIWWALRHAFSGRRLTRCGQVAARSLGGEGQSPLR